MRLRTKILIVALLPLAGFVLQSWRIASVSLAEHGLAETMQDRTLVLDGLSKCIHELQKERGVTSLYLSGGVGMAEVEEQRRASDRAIAAFRESPGRTGFPDGEFDDAVKVFNGIAELRQTADPALVRKGFTEAIRSGLQLYSIAIDGKTTKGIGKVYTSLAILEEAKEATGRLRALVSSLLARDSALGQEQLRQLFSLHSLVDGNLHSPALALGKKGRELLKQAENDESTARTEAIFWTLVDKSGSGFYGVDGKHSFEAFTRRIDVLDVVLLNEFQETILKVQDIHDEAESGFWSALLLGILLTAILALTVYLVVGGILRKLRAVHTGVSSVAQGMLPDIPAAKGSDELDQVQNALAHMVQALRNLLSDLRSMSRKHEEGQTDTFVDSRSFQGAFAELASEINGMVRGHMQLNQKSMDCVSAFGEGNFDTPLERFPGQKARNNEIIESVRSRLKAIVTELSGLIDAAKDGNLGHRGRVVNLRGDWESMILGVNELMDVVLAPVHEATGVLEKVASRDLSARVQGDYQGGHARIKLAINTAVENLDNALAQVSEVTDQVASASGQISQGSQSLAQGANEQASALEQVSSSLEEIAGMTRRSAASAAQAKDVVAGVDSDATQGTAAMSKMAASIARIQEDAAQTTKIVKTIDEIAMQTNLLALNAAVEAARAGEAGRGFAVVAEEVRNLAQRSAQAAKNTADLLGESLRNAEDGVQIAGDAGRSFALIVGGVQKINGLVGEIAGSEQEVSRSLDVVTESVRQVDKVTQLNAANSEESASASEELSGQAQELRAMVAHFQLSQSLSSGAQSVRSLPAG